MMKTKMTAVAATARRSGRQIQAGLDVVASDRGNRLNKKKRSALNDGNGKQKEKRPAVSDRRVTRFASKQQELENDDNRRIKDYGFDVGDIPLTVLGELEFISRWTEDPEEDCAPMEYEDLAKIGLKTFNLQNGTSYEFTKIVQVKSLLKGVYAADQIIFLAGGDSFVAKAGTIGNFIVVPFCKKVLDVVAEQEISFSDLTRLAVEEQLKERQMLLMEENQRIEKRHGPDFEGDAVVNGDNEFYPCWSESSGSPVPKIYEEMSKIGLWTYNCEFATWFQFVELLRVYFRKQGNRIFYYVYFRAKDSYVVACKVFKILVLFDGKSATVVSSRHVEPELEDIDKIAGKWGWYWCAAELREYLER